MAGRYPIVGTYYRGPAAVAVMAGLPLGAPMWIEYEPDNPADPNAVAVYLDVTWFVDPTLGLLTDAIQEKISDGLAGAGYSWDDFLQWGQVHLGFVPARMTHMVPNFKGRDPEKLRGHMEFGSDGGVRVALDE